MELRLNIYKDRKVEKTYTTKDFTLMTGTCEDILKLIDIDKFNNGLNNEAATMEIIKIVIKAFGKFRPLMQEIFAGLSDEEYSRTSIKEVASVVIQVVTYTITELFNISTVKN